MPYWPGLDSPILDDNSNGTQTSGQPGKTSENLHNLALSDTPIFQRTEREQNRQNLEKLRLEFNTQSLTFEPVQVDYWNNSIQDAMGSFTFYARIAAEHGSRVVRIGLNPDKFNLMKVLSTQEGRDEAFAIIYREYGIQPDRITFGMATRFTHKSAPQHLLWMDIDFG